MDEQVPTKSAGRDSKTGLFLKGNPGGPGRGNGPKLTDVLAKHLDPDELAEALVKLVRKGEFSAIAYAYDRLEGRPKQALDVSRPENDPGVIAMRELAGKLDKRGSGS